MTRKTENDRANRIWRSTFALLMVAAVFLSAKPLQAQTIQGYIAHSMYSDVKALSEGDIITVLIVESIKGSNGTETRTNSDTRASAELSTSGGLANLVPGFGGNAEMINRNESQGITESSGVLESKMTAIVTEVLENGMLVIQGTRTVNVNGEEQITSLSGIVRPEDVGADNTVYSFKIANAQISYKGEGLVTKAGTPGIFVRLWNWLF